MYCRFCESHYRRFIGCPLCAEDWESVQRIGDRHAALDPWDDHDGVDDSCEGFEECGGCFSCLADHRVIKTVIAREPRSKAGRARRRRNGIRPGDKIRTISGFRYPHEGGPRQYFRPFEATIERGPAWTEDEREAWKLGSKYRHLHGAMFFWRAVQEMVDFEDRTGVKVPWLSQGGSLDEYREKLAARAADRG